MKRFDKSYMDRLTCCIIEEENLLDAVTDQKVEFSFENFLELQVLVIKKKSIKSDWATLTNGLALIPNLGFRKLSIETESLNQANLEELANCLMIIEQKTISVEIRCDFLELELRTNDSQLLAGTIKGFNALIDKVKTHHILRYTCEKNAEHRIDIFTKRLATRALDV